MIYKGVHSLGQGLLKCQQCLPKSFGDILLFGVYLVETQEETSSVADPGLWNLLPEAPGFLLTGSQYIYLFRQALSYNTDLCITERYIQRNRDTYIFNSVLIISKPLVCIVINNYIFSYLQHLSTLSLIVLNKQLAEMLIKYEDDIKVGRQLILQDSVAQPRLILGTCFQMYDFQLPEFHSQYGHS